MRERILAALALLDREPLQLGRTETGLVGLSALAEAMDETSNLDIVFSTLQKLVEERFVARYNRYPETEEHDRWRLDEFCLSRSPLNLRVSLFELPGLDPVGLRARVRFSTASDLLVLPSKREGVCLFHPDGASVREGVIIDLADTATRDRVIRWLYSKLSRHPLLGVAPPPFWGESPGVFTLELTATFGVPEHVYCLAADDRLGDGCRLSGALALAWCARKVGANLRAGGPPDDGKYVQIPEVLR